MISAWNCDRSEHTTNITPSSFIYTLACFIKLPSFIPSFLCYVIFHVVGRFQISVKPDLSFKNCPTCTTRIVRCASTRGLQSVCVCGWVYIYWNTYSISKNNNKKVIRMPWSLTLIFPEKKLEVYKNLFVKGHAWQSNSLQFHFHFVLLSSCVRFSFSHPLLPPLSPIPVCLPPEHFSSDKQSPSCFPKQPHQVAISLSHLIRVYAFFPGSGDTGIMAR